MPATAAPPDVRDRILTAALQVLHTEGVRKFSQTRVAKEAKVRQSHVTYYFPTRADLLEATATRLLDRVTDQIAEGARSVADWDAGPLLATLADQMVGLDHMRMFLAMIIESDRDPAVRSLMVRGGARVREAFAAAIGGPDAEAKARVIQLTIWGLGLWTFANRPSPDLDPRNDTITLLEGFTR
jgi:AcrR family transcriptional regulator